MKKKWYFLAFLVLTGMTAGIPAFAKDSKGTSLYVQGSGYDGYQAAFFREAFITEAIAAGYKVTDVFRNADYGIIFEINPDADGKQSLLRVRLIRIDDLFTVVAAEYLFTDLEEMLPQNQQLFFMLMSNLPVVNMIQGDERWNNKWLYFRLSFDYPITFYVLQSEGLIAGTGIYEGSSDSPNRVQQLDNKVIALPGMTLGAELQLLNWMSIEPSFQANWENLNDTDFINLTAGIELKFPLKFIRNVMLEPYGAVSFPIPVPTSANLFASSPYSTVAFGGGLQIGLKAHEAGAVFVDLNYMYFGDVGVNNPYGEFAPLPKVIHYQRSVIGLGIGYKIGVFDRK